MNLFETYSNLVCNNIENNPQKSFDILKLGYWIEGNILSKFKEKNFLPSQKYLTKISMDFILQAMNDRDNSAIVNIFTPCEFLHAMNITPMFIEGVSSYISGADCEKGFIEFIENTGLSESYCSYHKTFLGASESKVLKAPKCAITTTIACDANINTFRRISKSYDIPKYIIDVPYNYSNESIEYVILQLKELVTFLEDNFKCKLSEEKLKEVIARENKCLEYYDEFLKELKVKYYPNTLTLEMYRIFVTYVFLGHSKSLKYYKMLLDDIKFRCDKCNGNRILWTHLIPIYSKPLKDIFNFNLNNQLVICDFNFNNITKLDINKPYESIAKKLILNKFNGAYERRADNILDFCNKLNIDGVVNFCHMGCKQSLGGANLLKSKLEENNIKTLILDGDGIDKRNSQEEQIRTRVEAFLDIVKAVKKTK
ncbi:2-hydroxyacyl-CoA dehydratase subunit D [Clostridium senegalense]